MGYWQDPEEFAYVGPASTAIRLCSALDRAGGLAYGEVVIIELKPEQERIIQEEIRSGHFRDAAEVLDHALAALQEKESKSTSGSRPRKNLVDVLTGPPFGGSELDIERQRDFPGPLDL